MVRRETGSAPAQREVIADVARRVQHVECPAIPFNALTISERLVAGEIFVYALTPAKQPACSQLLHDVGPACTGVTERQHRRVCGVGQRPCQWGMVNMGMGHDDMADVLVRLNGIQYRLQVGWVRGAGINHSQRAGSQDIGVGAAIGHGRRVWCHDPAQSGRKVFGHANRRVKVIGRQHGLTFRRGGAVVRV